MLAALAFATTATAVIVVAILVIDWLFSVTAE